MENEPDLAAELAKVTEEKATVNTNAATINETQDGQKGNEGSEPGETTQSEQPDAQQAQANAGDFDEEPINPEGDALDKTQEVLFDNTKLAPTIVDTLDQLVQLGLPWVYERALNPEDRLAMKLLARKYMAGANAKSIKLDENDQRIMELYIDYEDYCKELEFTEKEKTSLIAPLAEMLKDVKFQTSPGASFLIAIALIMAPRFFPIGIKVINNGE